MAFQGSLKELPLPDIIQLVAVSRKSGVFSIEEEGHRGLIVLREGEIVHAEVGDLRGEEAVYELAIWPEGSFQFDPEDSPAPDTPSIHKSNTSLLMEAARRMDEWRILSKKVPSTRMVPMLTRSRTADVTLNPRESTLVGEVDDRRTLEAIALALDESPFEIAKVAYGLVTAGVVTLRASAPWLDPSALARLTVDTAAALADRVHDTAAESRLSDETRDHLGRLRNIVRQSTDSVAAGAALTRQVRMSRQLISSELGSEQATEFFDRVEELFEGV